MQGRGPCGRGCANLRGVGVMVGWGSLRAGLCQPASLAWVSGRPCGRRQVGCGHHANICQLAAVLALCPPSSPDPPTRHCHCSMFTRSIVCFTLAPHSLHFSRSIVSLFARAVSFCSFFMMQDPHEVCRPDGGARRGAGGPGVAGQRQGAPQFHFFLTLLLFILPQPKWALMGRKPGSNKQAAQHSGCSARRPTTLAAPA